MRNLFGMCPILPMLLMTAGLFSGCSVKEPVTEPEKENETENFAGNVKFVSRIEKTRAGFETQAADQMIWQNGDRIKILCEDASGVKEAMYKVAPDESSLKGSVTPLTSSKAISWKESGTHTFYAVYPGPVADMAGEGILSVPLKHIQKCSVPTSNAYDNDVTASPDMESVYMVASAKSDPTEDEVELVFKPVMTTLQIKVQGPMSGERVRLTGLSVKSCVTTKSGAGADKCYYDISASKLTDMSKTSSGAAKTVSNTVYVELTDSEGKAAYVDVGGGHTLTLNVFLPPVPENTARELKYQVSVRAHLAMDSEVVLPVRIEMSGSDWVTVLPESGKYKLTLPAVGIGASASGNNWITPLPDDIPVSQMSIPGTHDAATATCSSAIGKCQVYTIGEQLRRGVRAFDLRPTMNDNNNLGNIYHGVLDTGVSMETAFRNFDDFLTANPGEFVIVIMRYESDRNSISESYYFTAMRSFLMYNEVYKSRKAAFKSNMKLKDLRGKILILSRNDLRPDGYIETAYTQWTHSNKPVPLIVKGTGGSATIHIQDMYAQSEDGNSSDKDFLAHKSSLVCGMMDIAARFSSDANLSDTWMVNYCSAYVGSIFSSEAYPRNAASTNAAAYNYLISTSKKTGPTGIVMMDYAGAGVYGNFNVFGDMLVQKIIDNNYRVQFD